MYEALIFFKIVPLAFKTVLPFCYPLVKVRGEYDKFPDFFRIGTFIDSTHMKP